MNASRARDMRWGLAVLAAPAVVAWATAAQAPDPPGRYDLRATVDTRAHRVVGHLRLHFVNTSHAPLSTLLFHLYPNAFEHDRTVFMREGGTSVRGLELGEPGALHISDLTVDGVPRLDQLDDELIPNDRTQARLPLARPLAPGAALDIEVHFETRLPRIVARMGHAGGFHMLAQWYPKLAKLEPDGHFAGFPYHGLGEFYADYADYRVHLDVPADAVSACGGQRVGEPHTVDGRRTERYRLSPAHDIACVVTNNAVTHRERAGTVALEVVAPRGYDAAARRQLTILRDGLSFFGRHFGPYPYADLRLVIPPRSAAGAWGMEYPGLIVTGGPPWSLPVRGLDPLHDIVTAHELAHQWFYGMLGSHEVAHPFLDEGLTEWSTWAMLQWRSEGGGRGQAGGLAPTWVLEAIGGFALSHSTPSALLSVDSYRPGELGRAVYLRPALALQRLSDRHGREAVLAALGRYARDNRFRHPTPQDLFDAIDATLGAGEARDFLEPRLSGQEDSALTADQPAAGTDAGAARANWFDTLLFLAQHGLSWLGP